MSYPSPPEPPLPPPASVRRARIVGEVCAKLSRDGAAAVLVRARAMLEEERRAKPNLDHVSPRIFAGRIELTASEMKEGAHRDRVLVAALHRRLCDMGEAEGLPLAQFKQRLMIVSKQRLIRLTACKRPERFNPLLVAASEIRYKRVVYHCMDRPRPLNVAEKLDDVLSALSIEARTNVWALAQRVREDEVLRMGRPRLATLSPEAFAARVQEIVNLSADDIPAVELFSKLHERGEVTGMSLETFKARLHAAVQAGRLMVEAGSTIVRRTEATPPIPWGPPAKLLSLPRQYSNA